MVTGCPPSAEPVSPPASGLPAAVGATVGAPGTEVAVITGALIGLAMRVTVGSNPVSSVGAPHAARTINTTTAIPVIEKNRFAIYLRPPSPLAMPREYSRYWILEEP